MDNGVQKRFSQRGFRHRIALAAIDALIADPRLQVLEEQHLHGPVDLREETARNNIVKAHIPFIDEIPELCVRTSEIALRIGVKEQNRRPGQVIAVGETELLDQADVAHLQVVLGQPLRSSGSLPKTRKCGRIKVFQRYARIGHSVPAAAGPAQEKAVEGGTAKGLVRAAAALVVRCRDS